MVALTVRGKRLQRLIAVLSSVAFLVQGYNQSIMNGFTTLPSFLSQIPEVNTVTTKGAQQAHNATILGLVVAIFEVGSGLGALACISLGDRLGRPKTMLVAGIVCTVGVIIQASTYSLGQIIAGRTITGFGIGLYTGTVPMYVSETAESSKRGALVLLEGPFALGGLAIASWINFGMFYASGSITWRLPTCLQLVFLLLLLIGTPFLPESPRWLVKQDKMEEAIVIMARLMDLPTDDPTVAREVATIHAAMIRDAGHRHKYSSNIFSMNENRHFHRLLLAMGGTMITQLTGINVIAFYSTQIFETTLGYSGSAARVFTACLQVTLALGGLTAIFLVERIGRRRLMMFSAASMVLAQAAVAGLSSDLTSKSSGKVAIFFYFWAMYTLPIGLFTIPFMYAAEIAPLGIRHKLTAMAAATSWFLNFMVAEVTPVAFDNIKWRYNIVYAAASAAGVVAIYFFYPETRGRSLEEVDEIFLASKSIWDPVRVAKRLPMGIDVLEEITETNKHFSESQHAEGL